MLVKNFFEHEKRRNRERRDMTAVAEVTSTVYKLELDPFETYISHPNKTATALALARRISEVLYRRMCDFVSGATLMRLDGDLLGYRQIPINVYWGVQTLRAKENFRLTGIFTEQFPNLQKAFAYVKKACAIANRDQGTITDEQARAIIMACDEILKNKLNNQFVTDMIQGGAGTSTNMNANEVGRWHRMDINVLYDFCSTYELIVHGHMSIHSLRIRRQICSPRPGGPGLLSAREHDDDFHQLHYCSIGVFRQVIANRANEILGDRKGTYKYVHPNDHVNKSQSTNDTYPTALHLSIVLSAGELVEKMTLLANALRDKGKEFDQVLKMGRTQLQDAVPITLGQEFFAWARGVEDEMALLRQVRTFLSQGVTL